MNYKTIRRLSVSVGLIGWRLWIAAGLVSLSPGCTSWNSLATPFTSASPGSSSWANNNSQAEFVPGQGYRVAGKEGYFDERGRPIGSAVAPVLEEESTSLWDDLQPQTAYKKIQQAVGQGADQQVAREHFNTARRHYAGKKYDESAAAFAASASRAGESPLAQDALFWRAESLFFADEYPEANDAYLQLIKEFPSTHHLDKAVARQAAIARYWQQKHQHDPSWSITPNLADGTRPRFDTLGHAIRTYENIRLNDPTGPLADDALMATANAYFTKGRYDDADYHYGLLRREYPKSEHQFEAHLLGLQCKLRKYQGPEYDATPLDEAEKLIKQLRRQFVGELSPQERQRIDEVAAQLQKHRAMRDWSMAQFYENREQYAAAADYYQNITSKFPQSELASNARDRMVAIAQKPAAPEERLSWLIKYMPESKERATLAVPIQNDTVRR